MRTPSPLLGCGIADSLGCPFEVPNNQPLLHPKLADWKGEFLSTRGGWHDLEPGQWSDDTQFSVALSEALLEDSLYMPATAGEKYLELYRAGVRGIGGTTKLAMEALGKGVSPNVSGIEGAEGNGTAMRASPIGLFFHKAPLSYVMDIARIDARITHRSLEAQEGSAAVAAMVALLSALEVTSPLERLRCLYKTWSGLRDSQVKERLGRLKNEKLWDATGFLAGFGPQDFLSEFGTRGHVVQTVPSAFAAFMCTDSYEDAIMMAIRAGGDTDTTGAIAGALAGAYYGFAAIPERLRDGVDQGDLLLRLDLKLAEGAKKFHASDCQHR